MEPAIASEQEEGKVIPWLLSSCQPHLVLLIDEWSIIQKHHNGQEV